MKRAGWLGILMIALGALMIWAGFNGVRLTQVIGSILRNEPLPTPGAPPGTHGDQGGSGFDDDAGAGDGGGGGGGGGW